MRAEATRVPGRAPRTSSCPARRRVSARSRDVDRRRRRRRAACGASFTAERERALVASADTARWTAAALARAGEHPPGECFLLPERCEEDIMDAAKLKEDVQHATRSFQDNLAQG